MNICIVVKESGKTRLPTRTTELAKRFVEQGHRIKVISTLDGPILTQKDGLKNILSKGLRSTIKEEIDGVVYYQVPKFFRHKDYYSFGLLNLFLYRLFLMLFLRRKKIDVVMTPSPTEGMIAVLGASMGIPFVFDYSEPYFKRSPNPNKTKNEERTCYTRASLIVSVGLGSSEYIRTLAPNAKIIEIPEGFDETAFNIMYNESQILELKKNLGIPPKSKVVLYMGKLWSKIYRVDIIPEIVSRVVAAAPETYCIIIGEGDYSTKLKTDIESKDIKCIFINRFIPHAEVPLYIASCDVGILPFDGSGAPLKVVEFLVLKKPIVMTHCKNLRDQIVDGKNGFMVENNPKEFAERILYFFNHECDSTVIDIQALSWQNLAKRYTKALEKLVK